jgi:mannitol-1-/sugar-/sorbitol-6-phosphatase
MRTSLTSAGFDRGLTSSSNPEHFLTQSVLRCRAVLFDLDGVLVDSEHVVVRTWNRWAARHGLDIPDLVRRAHGRRSIETVREVAPQLDAIAEARWLEGIECSDADGLATLPGAAELFQAVPPDRRAVVTSGGRALAGFRLASVGFPAPSVLISADDVQCGKPAPDGYLLAAERLGVAPDECLVIEDTPPGIAAGRAAGATVLAVATTFPTRELEQAHVVVASLAAVTSALRGTELHVVIAEGRAPLLPNSVPRGKRHA